MCIKHQELHSKPNATQNFQKSTKIMKCYNVGKKWPCKQGIGGEPQYPVCSAVFKLSSILYKKRSQQFQKSKK